MKSASFPLIPILWLAVCLPAPGGEEGRREPRWPQKIRVDQVEYRQARWETEAVHEPSNERPNRGGIVHVYMTNISDETVRLRHWNLNRKDESDYRLSGDASWDRTWHPQLAPGQTTVLEINGIAEDFAPGKPFRFAYIGGDWRPVGWIETSLAENPVHFSFIRVLPSLDAAEAHIRSDGGEAELLSLEAVGRETAGVQWSAKTMPANGESIARIQLAQPAARGELLILKLAYRDGEGNVRHAFAHRRAFPDFFPIGTWTNRPDTLELIRRHHIDMVVRSGEPGDEWFSDLLPRYGIRAMVPVEVPPLVDRVLALRGNDLAACWMLSDEPDWSKLPAVVDSGDRLVRHYDNHTPTFTTLCRNVKFFEYASIVDIPCMDHYSVTAPSSSRWPRRYGTRLEETAHYTRDLKRAAGPKPIWIWSQALADWSERPKRPVPTPDELAAQLVFNLGRGAKGILWFNFDIDAGDRFPDTRGAVQTWGRVMSLLREDFLQTDPADLVTSKSDEKIDAAALLGPEQIVLCLVNLNYEIHDEAYPWTPLENVRVTLRRPEWINPQSALIVSPDGIENIQLTSDENALTVELPQLNVCRVIVLSNKENPRGQFEGQWEKILALETQEF